MVKYLMTEETPKTALSVVVPFTGPTTHDLPVGNLLAAAGESNLKEVMIIGFEPDDTLYLATSSGRFPDMLWLLKLAERIILEQAYDVE